MTVIAFAVTFHKLAILPRLLSAGHYDDQAARLHSPAVLDAPACSCSIGPALRPTSQQLNIVQLEERTLDHWEEGKSRRLRSTLLPIPSSPNMALAMV